MAEPFTSDDPAQRLRDAWAELRTLPLGGRGYLADACLDGAAEIERLREAGDPIERELHEATITERDDEIGLVITTKDGRVYGLAFNRERGLDVLGVTALDNAR